LRRSGVLRWVALTLLVVEIASRVDRLVQAGGVDVRRSAALGMFLVAFADRR